MVALVRLDVILQVTTCDYEFAAQTVLCGNHQTIKKQQAIDIVYNIFIHKDRRKMDVSEKI